MNSSISFVIPALNEEQYIGKCIESILKYSQSVEEIIVVDNGSKDRTVEIASHCPKTTVILRPDVKGLINVRKCGFEIAKGDLIASLDADNLIHEKWEPVLLREFAHDPAMMFLSGPYHFYGFNIFLYCIHRTLNFFIAHALNMMFGSRVLGGNFVMRRTALQEINTLHAQTGFWAEDMELSSDFRKIGKIKYLESFYIYASTRRWKSEGWWKLGFSYLLNSLSVGFFHKSLSKEYSAIR